MIKEDQLRKSSHKLLLVVLKFIPMITALLYFMNTVFSCFGIDTPIFSHIAGMSLLPWLFIMIATYVFRFCIYHRMFLYYILTSDVVSIIDYYIGIPVNTFNMLAIHFCIAGVFLFIILYLYVSGNKKSAD